MAIQVSSSHRNVRAYKKKKKKDGQALELPLQAKGLREYSYNFPKSQKKYLAHRRQLPTPAFPTQTHERTHTPSRSHYSLPLGMKLGRRDSEARCNSRTRTRTRAAEELRLSSEAQTPTSGATRGTKGAAPLSRGSVPPLPPLLGPERFPFGPFFASFLEGMFGQLKRSPCLWWYHRSLCHSLGASARLGGRPAYTAARPCWAPPGLIAPVHDSARHHPRMPRQVL